ncbi:DUF2064 domain-containing protein [Crocosphaera sp.]|uniref:DUF2064 domain-containing protein n=1 Tax=Crocosphaera sp. TaxID=2729996 RepID=UPI003F28D75E|nr:DUF2064 domain-containing protein [Crocosphaera sp.]
MVKRDNLTYAVSIVLFTRYPDPGKVKTRLAWDIGDRLASEIHRTLMSQMLKILLHETNGVNLIVNYTGTNAATEMIKGFDPALKSDIDQAIESGILSFIVQPSTAFGERINDIAKQLGKVIIIGSDIPGITSNILEEAIESVNREQAVIALTEDGGYYLIGLPHYSDVFTTINYSLGNVGQQTYDLMQKNYSSASILNHSLVDLDEISDLQSLGLTDLIEQNQVNISVIIPTLNEVDSIYETLANIVKQAEISKNLEILVVDGGSKDETLQRVEDFKKDYPHLLIQLLIVPSLGRAFQMNTGLRHSSGKYLIFCHADTLLPSAWDEKITSVLDNEKVKLAYFDLQFHDEHLGLKLVAWTANNIRRLPYGDQVFCIRRDEFKKIGGFDYLCLLEDVTLIDNKIGYQNCQRIPQSIMTNPRKYSNKKGEYNYLSIFKNVGKNLSIMTGKKILNLPAFQLRKIHHVSSCNYELLEVPLHNKVYTFKYYFPNNLFHKYLIWKKIYYQKYMNQLIPKIIDHCYGDDLFIEFGGNVGLVSCLVSIVLAKRRIKTDIIAFESNSNLYQLFQENYSLYIGEMRNKIKLENVALREKLDDYEFPINKKISIIKIDLKGDELEILKGMKRTIQKYKPVLIFENFNPLSIHFLNSKNNRREKDKAVINSLNNLDYQVNQLSYMNYTAYPRMNEI